MNTDQARQTKRTASRRRTLRELEVENKKLRDALIRRHTEQSYPMPKYVIDAIGIARRKW